MSQEATDLQILASEIEKLEEMGKFAQEFSAERLKEVSVRWSTGSACVGYASMSDEVSKIVAKGMDAFMSAAVEVQRLKVQKAREVLKRWQP